MASGELDPRAPLVDEATFTLVADLQVRQAIRLQHYVSVLALEAAPERPPESADWAELHGLVADIVRDHIRSTDVVTMASAPPHLHVLLVSPSLDNLPAIIGRITAAVNGRGFPTDEGSAPVTLSLGGACFPTTARSRAELVDQAASLSVEARTDRGQSGHRYRLAEPAS